MCYCCVVYCLIYPPFNDRSLSVVSCQSEGSQKTQPVISGSAVVPFGGWWREVTCSRNRSTPKNLARATATLLRLHNRRKRAKVVQKCYWFCKCVLLAAPFPKIRSEQSDDTRRKCVGNISEKVVPEAEVSLVVPGGDL